MSKDVILQFFVTLKKQCFLYEKGMYELRF